MRAPTTLRVRRPVMLQRWRAVTFLHWRYPAAVVQRLLPAGLTVETFDGSAWVGLVPFVMEGIRAPGVPALPWLSRFPETNVRTYVRGAAGSGIWFLSLDAARLPAVVAGRAGYGLPYRWASMSATRVGDRVDYRSRRRGPAGARCDARVEFGARVPEDALGAADHFLTARHRLYAEFAGRLVTAVAEHPPWPLRRASVRELAVDLLPAGGLPAPEGAPLAQASDGVPVRIGRWRPTPRTGA